MEFSFALFLQLLFTSYSTMQYCFFGSVLGNIARVLSTDRVCEVGAMTEGNIFSTNRKNSYYCIYCQRVEDKKKWRQFAISSPCNGFTLPGHGVTL